MQTVVGMHLVWERGSKNWMVGKCSGSLRGFSCASEVVDELARREAWSVWFAHLSAVNIDLEIRVSVTIFRLSVFMLEAVCVFGQACTSSLAAIGCLWWVHYPTFSTVRSHLVEVCIQTHVGDL